MHCETEMAAPTAADHSRALADALRQCLTRLEREDLDSVQMRDARDALADYERAAPAVIAARVHVLAMSAYAVVQGDGWTADYKLAAGKSPAASLRASADEEAERGARLLRRAARMRAVADHMDRAR